MSGGGGESTRVRRGDPVQRLRRGRARPRREGLAGRTVAPSQLRTARHSHGLFPSLPHGVTKEENELVEVFDGDVLTPGLPSKNYTFRTQTLDDAKAKHFIPDIPATPIGYADAEKIFGRLDGPTGNLPEGFRSGRSRLDH